MSLQEKPHISSTTFLVGVYQETGERMFTVVVSAVATETDKTGTTTNGEQVNALYFNFFLFDIWQNVHNVKTIVNLVGGTKYTSLIMCPPLSFIFRTSSHPYLKLPTKQ